MHRLREAASACPNVTLRQGTAKRLLNGERLMRHCDSQAHKADAPLIPSVTAVYPVHSLQIMLRPLLATHLRFVLPAGAGNQWQEGDAVAGVVYSRAPRGNTEAAAREEVKAVAHLTIVCDGMYSSLRGSSPSAKQCYLALPHLCSGHAPSITTSQMTCLDLCPHDCKCW